MILHPKILPPGKRNLVLAMFLVSSFQPFSMLHSQNRDSILIQQLVQGKISRLTYYKSRSAGAEKEELKYALPKLRSQLQYPALFDFVVTQEDSSSLLDLAKNFWEKFERIPPKRPFSLEGEFGAGDYGFFWYTSFDRTTKYYLIGPFYPEFGGFYLMNFDSAHPYLLDKFRLDRQGSFEFDTLNGGNIIKIYYSEGGTGIHTEYFQIALITHNEFHTAFEEPSENIDGNRWPDLPTRETSTFEFKDINGDGFLDIVRRTSLDLIDTTRTYPLKWPPPKGKVLKNISKDSSIYIWNKNTLTFEYH